MSRVLAVVACGLTLAACSSSMPSLDFLRGSPPNETLRIESEPPGAEAKTAQGQTCRTPCELSVPGGADTSVTLTLAGYQPQTVPVHPEAQSGGFGGSAHLQPNPIYAELQPLHPPSKRPATRKRRRVATAPARSGPAGAPATAPASAEPQPAVQNGFPQAYPWPEPPR